MKRYIKLNTLLSLLLLGLLITIHVSLSTTSGRVGSAQIDEKFLKLEKRISEELNSSLKDKHYVESTRKVHNAQQQYYKKLIELVRIGLVLCIIILLFSLYTMIKEKQNQKAD